MTALGLTSKIDKQTSPRPSYGVFALIQRINITCVRDYRKRERHLADSNKEQGTGRRAVALMPHTSRDACFSGRLLTRLSRTSGWRWPSRTPPSTRPRPAWPRTGSRTAADRSTCAHGKRGGYRAGTGRVCQRRALRAQAMGATRSPETNPPPHRVARYGSPVLRWLPPYAPGAASLRSLRSAHGELESIWARHNDRAELTAQDRTLSRPAHSGAAL